MKYKRFIYYIKFSFEMNGRRHENVEALVSAYTAANAKAVIREYYDNDPKDFSVVRHATESDAVRMKDARVWHCSQMLTPLSPELRMRLS